MKGWRRILLDEAKVLNEKAISLYEQIAQGKKSPDFAGDADEFLRMARSKADLATLTVPSNICFEWLPSTASVWRCEYCGRRNESNRDQCRYCGAPQPVENRHSDAISRFFVGDFTSAADEFCD